jgi:hypothetical protein
MSVTLSNLRTLVRNNIGVFSTGTADNILINSAINRAIEHIKRRLGLPSDEDIQTILFSQDQYYYDLNTDFDEMILLSYHDTTLNTAQREWSYRSYPELLRRLGESVNKNEFSFTTINGRNQILMRGVNEQQGGLLESFDAVGNWTAEDDASGLALDENQKFEGTGSLSFDITNSAGYARLNNDNLDLDLDNLFENEGYLKLYTYMTDATIDDVTLYVKTDDSNYATITATVDDAGSAFAANDWIKIGFPTADAVLVGSPDYTDITEMTIEFDLGAGLTSVADFRVDYLFTAFPDQIDLVYRSKYKGTDTTGVTSKIDLAVDSDILLIGELFPDIAEVIAKRAALNLYPTIRGDVNMYSIMRQEFEDEMKNYGRIFPRRRGQVSYDRTRLQR